MDLFVLKKVIGYLIMPINLILILLVIGLITYRYRPQLSIKCTFLATILLFLSTFSPFSDWLMEPIEHSIPSYQNNQKQLDYIIVLGCNHTTDTNFSATNQLASCSLERLVEAIRIYRLHPEATLITSGGSIHDGVSNAEKVKQAAISLGIPANKIISENFPKDTEEEAELISPRIKGKSTALVTNADHMQRAIKFFQQQDANVIPAPASPKVKDYYGTKGWPYYMPKAKTLEQTTRAWYERIGQLWQWLKS